MKSISSFLLSFIVLLAAGCKEMDFKPAQVIRLGQAIQDYTDLDSAQQKALTDSLYVPLNALALALGQSHVSVDFLAEYSASQAMRIFQPDVDKAFPSLSDLERQLGHITAAAQRQNFSMPEITYATISWGKPQPLLRVENVMLIALNHYLGDDYPGYSHWHEYIRKTKAREFIQYDVASALAATQYPFSTHETPTLLNWMLYEGALIEAKMLLCYEPRLNMALGYSTAQMEWAEEHIQELWKELILSKMVYTTDPDAIDRYLVSAPYSPLAQNQAPGRIGRFIGYKIIQEYKKKQGAKPLSFFLSPEFYDSKTTLAESGF